MASSTPEKFKLLEELIVDLESEFQYQYNNNQKYSTNAFSHKAKKLNQEASKLLIEKLKEQKKKVNDYYDLLLNDETSRYVFRILALKEIMTNQVKYGYELPKEILYQQIPVKKVEVTANIDDLATSTFIS